MYYAHNHNKRPAKQAEQIAGRLALLPAVLSAMHRSPRFNGCVSRTDDHGDRDSATPPAGRPFDGARRPSNADPQAPVAPGGFPRSISLQFPRSGMSEPKHPVSHKKMNFLAGDGEMASLIRSRNWSDTPLGPIENWPQSLRTTVSLCLSSNFPIDIVWGPQHTQIYNDGYRVVCGEGHPAFLGMDFTVSWASAWPVIGEPFARARAGESSFLENQRIFIRRNGYLEETFFTFSFSPIRDETGGIGGLFHPVNETTASMLGERRTRAVRDLTTRLGKAKSGDEVFALAADTLAPFTFDLPFVLFYRLDQQAGAAPTYRLAAHTGLAAGTKASPDEFSSTAATPWPIADLIGSTAVLELKELAGLFGTVPCGPYDEPPNAAFAAPVCMPGSDLPAAVMIAGASPRLPMNDVYRGFFDLVAAAVAAGFANARAYEEECRRAEALAAIDRAKTAFFSNVSHEFRTPLTLMLGPLEDALAEPAALPAAQLQRLELAHRNALRLLRLVNSLLDFSRIEAGRAQARFQPLDVADLTAALASNFRSACERAGLELLVDCPPLDVPLYADPVMWEQIVLNLISNAFKFTLAGRITVTVRQTGAAVELIVHDTGVGIPAHELPRIFERFHRIEGQPGRTYEGSGIGLALVDELVKQHGGTISARSGREAGTEFLVRIPLGTAHLPPDRIHSAGEPALPGIGARAFVEEALGWLPNRADQEPAGSAPVADPMPAGKRSGTILLADDNADMRAYVAGILKQGGYQVEAVSNGQAALDAARRGPLPDLILTDIMMPGLDGFTLLRELRADPAMAGLLVILLSARAGEEARIEGLAAGADDYLIKPFSARELRARVDGAINLGRQRRDAAERERDLRAEIATERGRAALQQSEQRLAFALKAGRMGSWELDLVTGHLDASDIFRAHYGLSASDPVGTRDDLLGRVHPDDLELRRAVVSHAVETGEPLELEYRTVWPNGHVAWVQFRGQAVFADNGTPLRLIGVSLDVTARKQAEAEQKRLIEEKEQQRRELERSNADLERFAYAASHDLKAPLRAISHLAQWISDDVGPTANPETTENIELMLSRVARMQRLLDGLLAYARVGRIRGASDDVDIAEVVADIAAMLAPPAGFVIDFEGERSVMRVGRIPIQVVLENLIGNGLKHHDLAQGRITVAMRPVGGMTEFRVSDDGPGIAAQFHERIFEIFQTLVSRDEFESNGIGLAIVKKIVETHGGQIRVESAPPARGTTFVFTWKEKGEKPASVAPASESAA